MSQKEGRRIGIMAGVKANELSLVEAASVLGPCCRRTKHVWKRYAVQGDRGLVHGLPGQPGQRRKAPELGRRFWCDMQSAMRISGRRWRRSIWPRKSWWRITRPCAAGCWRRTNPPCAAAANEQDRDQVGALAQAVQQVTGQQVELAYVDAGHTGERAAAATEHGIKMEVVK